MSVWIRCDEKPGFSFHYRDLAGKVVQAALELERFPYDAEVSLLLTGDDEIRRINRETREVDKATDVLSFPMLEFDHPAQYSFLEDQWEMYADPDTGEIPLGDIVLSLDKVRAQADSYGHSEKREYAFLIAHSMLHLLGYDHMEPDERTVMEEHQRMIMNALKILR